MHKSNPVTPGRLLLLIVLFLCFDCKKENRNIDPVVKFSDLPVSKNIVPGVIDEASGIADSKINPGYLWVEQDGGNPNEITLLSYAGTVLKNIYIRSATNRDWEDLAVASGPLADKSYIYLADIGDNNQAFSDYVIYRFAEPSATADTVPDYDEIRFRYPDGSHDAEAILVNNRSKDIFIITKRDSVSRVYKLAYPQNTTAANVATYVTSLPFNGVVSAASSVINDEILVKTYTSLYYWKKSTNESFEQVLIKNPIHLSYQLEPQGEAVCFKNDNKGFYTLSERPTPVAFVNLNYYERK